MDHYKSSAKIEFLRTSNQDELQQLRDENARLKALLICHGIELIEAPPSVAESPSAELAKEHPTFTTNDKIALFRKLFRGRIDVYPLRWTSSKGTSGYSPACGNEWKPDICRKPEVKCGECTQRVLLQITDQVIYDHLAGKHTIGIYPLLPDDHCFFLAADFDEADWREDAKAFMQSCNELQIPATLEISRSGNGAHAWIFFADPVPAHEARKLGAALISHTCNRTHQLSLKSYDRFFPNQDTLPKGGFGNLIALPLQKQPRDHGHSVFVDDHFNLYKDQWSHLASIRTMSTSDLQIAILKACGGRHPLDIAFVVDEDDCKPWEHPASVPAKISGPLPKLLKMVLASQIYFSKSDLPQPLLNRLIRLAAFQNPEFYRAQAMRLPVWNKPRIIGCAENFPQHIGLPRGCLDAVLELLSKNHIRAEIQDKRLSGTSIDVQFTGVLRQDQELAMQEILKNDIGVLNAPTAFGKTVTAASLIAQRKVSTLILVHRTELLRQWQERLINFLDFPKGGLGIIGGSKKRLSGKIDIAVIQSLSHRDDLAELLEAYGQIIIDECHHISAFSFESILKQVKARYVVGLTATPVRRDGHQPIIFMQCGPIRHIAKRADTLSRQLEVRPNFLSSPATTSNSAIQETFRILANDSKRNERITKDVAAAYEEGRKILVLTERTEQIKLLRKALGNDIKHCFVIHGRLSRKERTAVFAELKNLGDATPRVLIATGRLIGEGFDHPPLDTLVLAMPISWKGTLQQYAGRLHREYEGKRDIRIYDYIEIDQPQLSRMWTKRQLGYRAMGYIIQPRSMLPFENKNS
jgi:superfamily II DNA or RNA helicase